MNEASQLHDLGVAINAFDTFMARFFEGETDPEEKRTWTSKLRSLRKVLLFQVNSIIDLHGAPNRKGLGMRESILWDVLTDDLKKYGIVLTEDKKAFTFEKDEDAKENPSA